MIDLNKVEFSVPDLLDKVAAEICNNYCKWPGEYNLEDDEGLMFAERCEHCPLRFIS